MKKKRNAKTLTQAIRYFF